MLVLRALPTSSLLAQGTLTAVQTYFRAVRLTTLMLDTLSLSFIKPQGLWVCAIHHAAETASTAGFVAVNRPQRCSPAAARLSLSFQPATASWKSSGLNSRSKAAWSASAAHSSRSRHSLNCGAARRRHDVRLPIITAPAWRTQTRLSSSDCRRTKDRTSGGPVEGLNPACSLGKRITPSLRLTVRADEQATGRGIRRSWECRTWAVRSSATTSRNLASRMWSPYAASVTSL